jgi:hypothetical protein
VPLLFVVCLEIRARCYVRCRFCVRSGDVSDVIGRRTERRNAFFRETAGSAVPVFSLGGGEKVKWHWVILSLVTDTATLPPLGRIGLRLPRLDSCLV